MHRPSDWHRGTAWYRRRAAAGSKKRGLPCRTASNFAGSRKRKPDRSGSTPYCSELHRNRTSISSMPEPAPPGSTGCRNWLGHLAARSGRCDRFWLMRRYWSRTVPLPSRGLYPRRRTMTGYLPPSSSPISSTRRNGLLRWAIGIGVFYSIGTIMRHVTRSNDLVAGRSETAGMALSASLTVQRARLAVPRQLRTRSHRSV